MWANMFIVGIVESAPVEIEKHLLSGCAVLVGKIEKIDEETKIIEGQITIEIAFHPMDLRFRHRRRNRTDLNFADRILRIFVDVQRGDRRFWTHLLRRMFDLNASTRFRFDGETRERERSTFGGNNQSTGDFILWNSVNH